MRWLVLFFLIPLSAFAQKLDMKSEVEIAPGAELTLFSLVDERRSEGIDGIRDQLQKLVIMQMTEPGQKLNLSTKSIAAYLKMALTAKERDAFKISIPRRIEIRAKSPELNEENITQILSKEWAPLCEPCQIEIKDLRLPIGKFKTWEIVTPQNIPKGSFHIPLRVVNHKDQETRFWIQGKVDILKEVPVATRALSIGDRIQNDDFTIQWQSVTHANDGAPTEEQLIGSQVRLPILARQIIWSRSLAREKALRRGDQVRVVSAGGIWELSVLAVAEGDAEIGDTITLKNPSTNKKVVGLVTGKGEVQVQ